MPAVYKNIEPTYDISRSWEYNFEKGPFFQSEIPPLPTTKPHEGLLHFKLNSLLGVAAGLLLNSKWVKLYSNLGFDILTYKTVRSLQHECHPHPNCLYIDPVDRIDTDENSSLIGKPELEDYSIERLSITNSFGIPSQEPRWWSEDVAKAKACLKEGQILIVSVVGTSKESNDVEAFIRDFQTCALGAKQAGADIVELDLSCPNSPVEEGDLFRDPDLSSRISKAVKEAIKETPLFIKIGYLDFYEDLKAVVKANAPFVQGVAGINTIKKKVVTPEGKPALGPKREKSGVCGALIREFGLTSARRLVQLRKEEKYDFAVIGIGGAMTPQHIQEYLDVGVDAVQVVTAAMFDPYLAYKYKTYIDARQAGDS
jgi:dihydroorotate dehydrogenase (NAD+) catalytic subunit